ncbi:hypothetical protein FCL47_23940 [Desulfopila sp. IMCC35006]|uniref:hypothetical protein n=1 Tax=Desulfopila sp. IMCC35006 TaxID=2569542 RepID=UPI0010AB70B8|nr:hypothetical protein [Desulfopila sp. IMCC35006]TKB23090.1 hypothetical protein FCL47_23940 [Desulfopila sp. IMCC35006]
MFESSKNDLARNVLFGERVKTILFLSMINEFPISFLAIKETQKIDQATIKRGVVKVVSPGSGAEWQRCFSGSFILDTDNDNWLDIKDVHSISLSETKDTREFLKHEMSLNRVQHFWQVYTGTAGRRKTTLEIDDGNDSKYYKLLSYIKR